MKEIAVAKIDDLQDGQTKQVEVEDSALLLAKIDGQIYATGAYCTHYGAPLAKGVSCNKTVVCPWHNACFDLTSGEQLEPPGLNDLPKYKVRIEGEDIYVAIPEEIQSQRMPEMAQQNKSADDRTMVVLGAGIAGVNAVETLRKKGYQGKIVMVSAEEKLPYDRTKLSKAYLQGQADEDSLAMRSCEFYEQNDIELLFARTVTKLDSKSKCLTFQDGSSISYDKLLIATGGKARKLDVPGSDLANIFTVRQPEDVNSILKTVKNAQKALVIGSSFIGMEAAASLIQQGLEVTVVSSDNVPFKKILGDKLGKMFQQVHEEKGVSFIFGTKAKEFKGDSSVTAAMLENGDTIETDLVILGIGVQPNTNFVEGIELNEKDSSVPVNEYLQSEQSDVYGAGDIARFPYAPMGEATRIEHWRLAAQHGRIAAVNMLAGNTQAADNIVPFFWSGQYDLKLRYVGHAEEWDELHIDGDLDKPEFLAFYLQNNKVMAVAGINRDKDIAAISQLMRDKSMPEAATVKQTSDWVEKL